MSLKSITNTEVNIHELIMEIDAETFENAVEAVYQREKANIVVAGFRKGKATRKMIETQYGEGFFYEKALNSLIDAELNNAINETKLELVTRPSLEVVSLNKNEGVVLKATCTSKPEIKVDNYIGIRAPKNVNTITDNDVNARINMILEKNARIISIEDRPAEMGDEVVIDFEGFIDGEAFNGGKGEEYALRLGSGQFIPGFEEKIVGHNNGEEFEIEIPFPEDYTVADIAGKNAVFRIKIHEITALDVPELDDEFVKDISEFNSVEELKADIRAELEEQAEKTASVAFEKFIFDTIIDNVDAEIPNCMFENRIDMLIADFERTLKSNNMTLENYLKYTNMTKEQFRETFDERAEKEVILRLALEKIASLENITVSDEEVEENLQKLCEANNYNIDVIKANIPYESYRLDLIANKVANFVKEKAIIDNTVKPSKDNDSESEADSSEAAEE